MAHSRTPRGISSGISLLRDIYMGPNWGFSSQLLAGERVIRISHGTSNDGATKSVTEDTIGRDSWSTPSDCPMAPKHASSNCSMICSCGSLSSKTVSSMIYMPCGHPLPIDLAKQLCPGFSVWHKLPILEQKISHIHICVASGEDYEHAPSIHTNILSCIKAGHLKWYPGFYNSCGLIWTRPTLQHTGGLRHASFPAKVVIYCRWILGHHLLPGQLEESWWDVYKGLFTEHPKQKCFPPTVSTLLCRTYTILLHA